jgi:hypothetical protein
MTKEERQNLKIHNTYVRDVDELVLPKNEPVVDQDGVIQKIVLPYGPKRSISAAVGKISPTKQEFRDDCDVNNIIRRHSLEHIAMVANAKGGNYIDCPSLDYKQMMDMTISVQAEFGELTAELRDAFDNDPEKWLAFLETATEDDMREAGLLPTDEVGNPLPAEPRSEATAAEGGEPAQPASPSTTPAESQS